MVFVLSASKQWGSLSNGFNKVPDPETRQNEYVSGRLGFGMTPSELIAKSLDILSQLRSLSKPGFGTVSHWGQTVDLCMNSSEWEWACVAMHFADISAYFIAFPRLGLAPSLRPRLPISIVIPDQPLFSPFYEPEPTLFPCFLSPAFTRSLTSEGK
jgi:hypothetical protein